MLDASLKFTVLLDDNDGTDLKEIAAYSISAERPNQVSQLPGGVTVHLTTPEAPEKAVSIVAEILDAIEQMRIGSSPAVPVTYQHDSGYTNNVVRLPSL
jgi:hypothetical protein